MSIFKKVTKLKNILFFQIEIYKIIIINKSKKYNKEKEKNEKKM